MKESYGEGVASHTGPESCGDGSNAMAEALTGEHTGGLLSSEIKSFQVPTLWSGGEGPPASPELAMAGRQHGLQRHRELQSDRRSRGNPSMCGSSLRGNREVLTVASGHGTGVRSGKVSSRMPDMYAIRKSDGNIVPKKQANKEGVSSAGSVEARAPTKRNTGQLPTVRTQGRGAVSSRLAGVRQAAQRRKDGKTCPSMGAV